METQTLGMMIAAMRKERGMTQLELAEKLNVTDKAVSKWERDLSCPDVKTIPRIAEIFGISVDELMQVKTQQKPTAAGHDYTRLVHTVLRGVGAAMGVAVAVLSAMKQLDIQSGMGMLGIGLACLGIAAFSD